MKDSNCRRKQECASSENEGNRAGLSLEIYQMKIGKYLEIDF